MGSSREENGKTHENAQELTKIHENPKEPKRTHKNPRLCHPEQSKDLWESTTLITNREILHSVQNDK